MTGASQMLGNSASDKSRGSGDGNVHSGNVYRVARLTGRGRSPDLQRVYKPYNNRAGPEIPAQGWTPVPHEKMGPASLSCAGPIARKFCGVSSGAPNVCLVC